MAIKLIDILNNDRMSKEEKILTICDIFVESGFNKIGEIYDEFLRDLRKLEQDLYNIVDENKSIKLNSEEAERLNDKINTRKEELFYNTLDWKEIIDKAICKKISIIYEINLYNAETIFNYCKRNNNNMSDIIFELKKILDSFEYFNFMHYFM